jgi:ATP-dependent Clp protease ATP-binding subunit ClpA
VVIRTQLAAVSPARRHTPGIHTRTTGFLPFTSPARDAAAIAFREARHNGHRHWSPGHLLLGLAAQDQGTAARALERLGISQEQVRRQAGQITARDQQQAEPAPQPPGGLIQAVAAEAAAHCDYRIGTDHLLLALFRADDQRAAQALTRLGAGKARSAARSPPCRPSPARNASRDK